MIGGGRPELRVTFTKSKQSLRAAAQLHAGLLRPAPDSALTSYVRPACVHPAFRRLPAIQGTVLILCCRQKANKNMVTLKSLLNSEHLLPFPDCSLLFHIPS